MLKRLLKDQDGSVFIVTLMILVVLSILGTAVINVTLSNNKMSIHDNEYQSVYYLAEAGVRYVGNSIATNIEDIYLNSDSKNEYFNNIDAFIYDALYGYNSGANSDDFIDVRGSQPDITISLEDVENTDDSRIYTFLSTGNIDGINREVIQKIEVKYPNPYEVLADMAVFADGEISLSGSGKIIGPVGTNLTSSDAISIEGGGGIRIDGDCYLPEGAPEDAISVTEGITLPEMRTTPERNYTMPTFPEFPSYGKLAPKSATGNQHLIIDNDGNLTAYENSLPSDNYILEINSNAYIPQFNITDNVNLSIKTDTETYLVVDDINVGGKLDIIGNGSITMYVNNSITIEYGDFNLISPDESHIDATEQLTIYYKGTNPLLFGSNIDVFGSLYAETAKITLDNGGGFQGHIVTGSTEPLEIKGDFDAYSRIIYAPFAPIVCTASGVIEGSIICKSMEVSGAGQIEFVASDDHAAFPFPNLDPNKDNLIPAITPIRER